MKHTSSFRCSTAFAVSVFLLVATLSCDFIPLPGSDTRVMHPTPENLPAPDGPLVRMDSTLTNVDSVVNNRWLRARRSVLGATRVSSIDISGEADSAGTVANVAVDHYGNVYVFDRAISEMRAFDRDGRILARATIEGMMSPDWHYHLEVVSPGSVVLFVTEAPAIRIELFGSETPGTFVMGQDLEPPIRSVDVCSFAGRLFVLGFEDREATGSAIHEVSAADGSVANSFGTGYRSPWPEIRLGRSWGGIACSVDPGIVVYGFESFPIVRGYDPGKGLLWTAVVDEFEQARIFQRSPEEDFDIEPSVEGSEYERLSRPYSLAGGVVVLQVRLLRNDEYGIARFKRLRTYLLDAATGEGGWVSDEVPRIAAAKGLFFLVVHRQQRVVEVWHLGAG